MPPNEELAMGTMTSEPRPVLLGIGSNARMGAAFVLCAALERLCRDVARPAKATERFSEPPPDGWPKHERRDR